MMLRMDLPPLPRARRNPKHGSSCFCVTCAEAIRQWDEWTKRAKWVQDQNEKWMLEENERMKRDAEEFAKRRRGLFERLFGW